MKSNHPITSRKTTCSWKKSGGTMPSVTRHRNSRERGEKKFFFSILSCKTAFLWNQRLSQWRDLGGGVFEYLPTNSPRRGIPTISVKMNVRLWQADDNNIGGALRDIQKKKTRLQMRLTINPFYFALFSVTSNSVISNSSLFPTDLFVVLGKMFPQLTMQSRYPLLHPYLNNFTFIAIQQ